MPDFRQYLFLLIFIFLSACQSNPSHTSYGSIGTAATNPSVLIMTENIKALDQYINQETDINKLDKTSFSLLHKAVMFDKPKAAELILKYKADINRKGMGEMPPLFFVKSTAMIKILLRHHVDINAQTNAGMGALFIISEPSLVEELIKNGADTSLATSYGQTALTASIAQIDIYKKILSENKNPSLKHIYEKNLVHLKKKIKILKRYESIANAPEIIVLARSGKLNELIKKSKTVNVITTIDIVGNTALHAAAKSNRLSVVKYLAKNKKLLTAKNQYGDTALDSVIATKSDSAKYLSCKLNKHCKTPTSFSNRINKACASTSSLKKCETYIGYDIHGIFITADLKERAKNIRFNSSCKKFNYKKCKSLKSSDNNRIYAQKIDATLQLHTPSIEKKFKSSCSINSKKSRCIAFIKTYPGFKSKKDIDHALLFLSQKCRIKESGWLYKSTQCKSGYANGKGNASNPGKQLTYAGQFRNGHRTQGKIYYNGTPMYDGSIKNGKPNGIGVCFNEGEPEECKYYEGKRIDSLYKQRIEMAKQTKLIDEKLSKMQALQSRTYQQPRGTAKSKTMGDVIMDKAMDKALDKVFDSLF